MAHTKNSHNTNLFHFTDFRFGFHRHCSTTAVGKGEGGCSGGEGGGGGGGGNTVDGIMGGNDGGDVAVAVAANAVPGGGGGGGGGERRGSMVIRVQMLDDSISLFQVQVRRKEGRNENEKECLCGKKVSSPAVFGYSRENGRGTRFIPDRSELPRCSLSRSSGPTLKLRS